MAFAASAPLSAHRRLGLGVLAVALTAVLIWFGTGLHPRWPLMWFAPVPVLLFASGARWWSAALAAVAAWLSGTLNLWHYLHGALHLPAPVLAGFYGLETLGFATSVLVCRALLRRGAPWSAIAAFAGTRVALEYLLSIVAPHGTAGSLAYTQVAFRPFLQLASITGPWGMTFLVLAFPAALATAWHVRRARRQAVHIVAAIAAPIALVLVFGAVRLAATLDGPTVRVGLVASDPPVSPEVAGEGAATRSLLEAYASRAGALARQGAQLIVLPEKLGVAVGVGAESDAPFQAIADQTGATIVVGLIRVTGPSSTNEARVVAPGQAVQSYTKHHLLPPFESRFTPGDSRLVVSRPQGNFGVAICKDMDFTPLSRAYGSAGVGLMLVPAWDFVLDRRLHGHMAVMRGVESGFGVVRAAKQGYLTVSDSRGRIVAETTSDSAPFATLLAPLHAAHDATLYVWLGDWFAHLTMAALVAALVQLVRQLVRRRARAPS